MFILLRKEKQSKNTLCSEKEENFLKTENKDLTSLNKTSSKFAFLRVLNETRKPLKVWVYAL